jgi:hypothetical protein
MPGALAGSGALVPLGRPRTSGHVRLAPTPDARGSGSSISPGVCRPLGLEQETLALLEHLAPAHQLPQRALELGLLAGVQPGEPEEFLDSERLVRFRQESLHIMRKFGHEWSQTKKPEGP